jgi:hypothetical protein
VLQASAFSVQWGLKLPPRVFCHKGSALPAGKPMRIGSCLLAYSSVSQKESRWLVSMECEAVFGKKCGSSQALFR